MERHTLVVVDIGTQSLRASLVDQRGKILRLEREIYEAISLRNPKGYAEQWPDFYWNTLVKALGRLTSSSEFKAVSPIGLVMCDFRDTAALLDKDLKPIRPSILWLDSRSARLEKDSNLSPSSRLLMSLSGMRETARYNARRTPAQWLKENEPQVWIKVAKYVPLSAYLNLKMTDRLVCSDADCVGHYPINFKKGKWLGKHNLRWQIFGIRPDQLCELVPVGDLLGRISLDCSKATGLPEGLPVIASAADKAAEVLGNGCYSPDRCTISLGTACTVDQPIDRYKDSEPFLPSYRSPVKGLYNMEVQIYRGFSMLRWFSENFASDEEKFKADKEKVAIENVFDSFLREVKPGADGLLVQPYWGPSLSRPLGRGAMIGFTDVHDRRHIYRALIEGIVYALREGLETLEKRSGTRAKVLVVSGGGSSSQEVQRIVTDIFNLPTLKAETPESSTVGAALGGFASQGVFKDVKAAVTNMIRTTSRMDPKPENASIYEGYYQTYKKIYPALEKLDSTLHDLSYENETI